MPVAAAGSEQFEDGVSDMMDFIGAEPTDEEREASIPALAPPQQKTTKPLVGIIYPPPEVRNIVDKTASFVARNGPDFETRIRQNEQNNPKFNFLSQGDPYHAYYQHKVKEIQEGKTAPSTQTVPAGGELLKPPQQLIDEAKKKKQADLLKQVELPFVPKDPPLDFEFIADPPSISAHDLDVVKLTAQFVARNGRQFLSTLMTREQRNYQFDFLRPQHSLFQYFTKLLEQYTKVLIPPKDVTRNLGNENRKKVLDDVKYRTNWIKHQEVQRRKVEEEVEKERSAYASIDWHDFVVVETVDYQPFEQGQFPPPTTPQEVGARVLLQDRILQGQVDKDHPAEEQYPSAADDTQVQDMEEDSDSSSEDEDESKKRDSEPNRVAPIPATAEPPREDQVIIKKGYDPKQTARGAQVEKVLRPGPKPEEYTISPITGERIPVSKLQEHMRIGLLDPRWRDQRDRQLMEKVNQESVFAAGFSVDESLKQFAERRSDIFGVGVEETPIGKKVGEEERVPGLPWDPTPGLSSSIAAAHEEELNREDAGKKDSIGPAIVSAAPSHMSNPSGSSGGGPQPLLQPPAPSGMPPLPQIPGVVRQLPMGGPGPMPHGMMMMQRMGMGMPHQQHPHSQGPPGFSPYNPAPPGTHQHRPALLNPAPPVLPPMQHLSQQPPPPIKPMNLPPPPMPKPPPPVEEEPAAKKAKTLEDSLLPEAVFFATNPPASKFSVLLPSFPDKPELNLSGQIVNVEMALTEHISLIKTKIHELIGLPPGKQKLSMEGLFYKDNKSLAFYNIGHGTSIQMSLKERGGRKK